MMDNRINDPAPITRFLRSKAGSDILVVAVHHLGVFESLSEKPRTITELQEALGLQPRPAMVLFPSLCAMGLLDFDAGRRLFITPLGSFLSAEHPTHLRGYLSLGKDDPGVLQMSEWLKHDGPSGTPTGVSFVKDDTADSPMDDPGSANFFTMALAGRAKLLSPVVAEHLPESDGHLLDIAGGTGYYTYEWLLRNPAATATVADRPAVLDTARSILAGFHGRSSVSGRVHFLSADMLTDELPKANVVLTASLFHDWPEDVCQRLARKFAGSVVNGGELWVHDAFLNDGFDGPVAVTDYSAMLFLGTKGRCYSRSEYRQWLRDAGLVNTEKNIPTLLDYSLISARKED